MESVYEECLCFELSRLGLAFKRQVELPVRYKGVKLDCGFRMDLVVEDSVVVELKAIDSLLPIHLAQLLTYLKLSGMSVGLLLNFNEPVLKKGIKRLVNHYMDVSATSASSAAELRERDTADSQDELSLSQRLCVSAVK